MKTRIMTIIAICSPFFFLCSPLFNYPLSLFVVHPTHKMCNSSELLFSVSVLFVIILVMFNDICKIVIQGSIKYV